MEKIFGSIADNFEQALLQEQLARDCGPGDPYTRIARANVEYYLACAAALERGETHIKAGRG